MSELDDHPESWLEKPDNYVPGSMGCHELLHMVNFFAHSLDTEICEHPAVKNDEDWEIAANDARRSLERLYQLIGAKHLA